MSPSLALALQITLIGMGLVFGAILLLWLIMSALVRLATERETAQAETGDRDRKRRAAAAAVAVALAHETAAGPRAFPLPPTAFVSAWQAVMRGAQLRQRGSVGRK